jgi:hypothetical protein
VCTVSLLAPPRGGYLLAANRDEFATRGEAKPPERARAGANRFVAPRDPDKGGTWIAVDRAGCSLCLLNGDRVLAPSVAVRAAAPARGAEFRSRGLLVLDLLEDPRPSAVAATLRALHRSGRLVYRPFKLVAVAPRARGRGVDALEIEFDGHALRCTRLAAPHVETSNGFDPAGVARARGASFGRLVARLRRLDGARWRDALLAWHRRHLDRAGGAAARRRSVCVHGPRVRTVSCTLVEVGAAGVSMRYQPGPPCRGFPGVERAP